LCVAHGGGKRCQFEGAECDNSVSKGVSRKLGIHECTLRGRKK
jgi:hypothetical protein